MDICAKQRAERLLHTEPFPGALAGCTKAAHKQAHYKVAEHWRHRTKAACKLVFGATVPNKPVEHRSGRKVAHCKLVERKKGRNRQAGRMKPRTRRARCTRAGEVEGLRRLAVRTGRRTEARN